MTLPAIAPREQINFTWLARLRWSGILGQLATVATASVVLPRELLVVPLLVVIAAEAVLQLVANAVVTSWASARWSRSGQTLLGAIMIGDLVALTALLALSGGPANPFSLFLLVHVVLGAMLLSTRWAWALQAVAVAGFGLLFVAHVPVPSLAMHHDHVAPPAEAAAPRPLSAHAAVEPPPEDLAPNPHAGHHHVGHGPSPTVLPFAGVDAAASAVNLHLLGMFVAFVLASALIVAFGTRTSAALARRDSELAELAARTAREHRLAALGTLAAGAAHELATPLGTVAVAASELHRAIEQRQPELADDTRLILDEVARCSAILGKMSLDAGRAAGEPPAAFDLRDALAEACSGLDGPDRVYLRRLPNPVVVRAPRTALVQSLRALINNALQAAPGSVRIDVVADPYVVAVAIDDQGPTLTPAVLDRIGEPFFTTRDVGRGMGLGVYLARSVIGSAHGTLVYTARDQGGTRATVTLPLEQAP